MIYGLSSVGSRDIGAGNTFSRTGIFSRRASHPSIKSHFSFICLKQGHQRIKRGTYFLADGRPLNPLSETSTVLYTNSNVQLSRYDEPFVHLLKVHGLSSGCGRAEFTFQLLMWLSGAPGYGRPPAFGGFPGGSAPQGMGAPPGTGRPQ